MPQLTAISPTRNKPDLILHEKKAIENDESIPESIIPIKLPVIQGGEDSNPDIRAKRDTVRKVTPPSLFSTHALHN